MRPAPDAVCMTLSLDILERQLSVATAVASPGRKVNSMHDKYSECYGEVCSKREGFPEEVKSTVRLEKRVEEKGRDEPVPVYTWL